jgi:hypothetical protein
MTTLTSTGDLSLAPAGGLVKCSGGILDNVLQLSITPPTDAVVYVSSAGNDVSGTGSVSSPFLTLPRAFKLIASTGWDRSATVVIASAAFTLPAGVMRLEPGSLGRQQFPVNVVGGAGTLGRTLVGSYTTSITQSSEADRLLVVGGPSVFTSASVGQIVRFTSGVLSAYAPPAPLVANSAPAAALGALKAEGYISHVVAAGIVRVTLFAPNAAGAATVAGNGDTIDVLDNATTVTAPVDSVVIQSTARKIVWRNLDFQFAGTTAASLGAVVFDGLATEMYGVRVLPFLGTFAFRSLGAACSAGGYAVNSGCAASPWQTPSILGFCARPQNANATVNGRYDYTDLAGSRWQCQNSMFHGQGRLQGAADYRGCSFYGGWQILASNARVSLASCRVADNVVAGTVTTGSTVQALAGGSVSLANSRFLDINQVSGNPAVGGMAGGTVTLGGATTGAGVRFDACARSLMAGGGKVAVEGALTLAAGTGPYFYGAAGGDIVVTVTTAPTVVSGASAPMIVLEQASLYWRPPITLTGNLADNGLIRMLQSRATFVVAVNVERNCPVTTPDPCVYAADSDLCFLKGFTGYEFTALSPSLFSVSRSRVLSYQNLTLTAILAALSVVDNSVLNVIGQFSARSNGTTVPAARLSRSQLTVSDYATTSIANMSLSGGSHSLYCTQSTVTVRGFSNCDAVLLESNSSMSCASGVQIVANSAIALSMITSELKTTADLTVGCTSGRAFVGSTARLQVGSLTCTSKDGAIDAVAGSSLLATGAITVTVSDATSTDAAIHLSQSDLNTTGALSATGTLGFGLHLEQGSSVLCNSATCASAGSDGTRLEESELTTAGSVTSNTTNASAYGINADRSTVTSETNVSGASTVYLFRSECSVAGTLSIVGSPGPGLQMVESRCRCANITSYGNNGPNVSLAQRSTLNVVNTFGVGNSAANIADANATTGRTAVGVPNLAMTQESQMYVDGLTQAAGCKTLGGRVTASCEISLGSRFVTDRISSNGSTALTDSEYGVSVTGGSYFGVAGAQGGSTLNQWLRGGLYVSASAFNAAGLSLVTNGSTVVSSAVNGGGIYMTDGARGVGASTVAQFNSPGGVIVTQGSRCCLVSANVTLNKGVALAARNGSAVAAITAASIGGSTAIDATSAGVGNGVLVDNKSSLVAQNLSMGGSTAAAALVDYLSDLCTFDSITTTFGVASAPNKGIVVDHGSAANIDGGVGAPNPVSVITASFGPGLLVDHGSRATLNGTLTSSTNSATYGLQIRNGSRVTAVPTTVTFSGATAAILIGSRAATTWAAVSNPTSTVASQTDYSGATTIAQMCSLVVK